jgi:hypothetical protein
MTMSAQHGSAPNLFWLLDGASGIRKVIDRGYAIHASIPNIACQRSHPDAVIHRDYPSLVLMNNDQRASIEYMDMRTPLGIFEKPAENQRG